MKKKHLDFLLKFHKPLSLHLYTLRDYGVEMKVTVFLILTLLSFNVFSETYVCSHELSEFGRPGEIETKQFKREGRNFVHGSLGIVYEASENSSFIFLTSIDQSRAFLNVVIINKISKEWKRQLLMFEENFPTEGGKCVVVN